MSHEVDEFGEVDGSEPEQEAGEAAKAVAKSVALTDLNK